MGRVVAAHGARHDGLSTEGHCCCCCFVFFFFFFLNNNFFFFFFFFRGTSLR